jgi:hypothetical protein
MRVKWIIAATFVLSSAFCAAQESYMIPLEKANSSLAVPEMAERNGVIYVAYRSFDFLKDSDQLQVLAYDLSSHKELHHGAFSVPKVQGARAANGLTLSKDGNMLAYVEMHNPSLVLLLSTKDLSEIRRSNAVPFTDADYRCEFDGFDGEDRLSFMSFSQDVPRFLRLSATDFKVASDTRASSLTKAVYSSYLMWNPVAGRFWMPDGGGNVLQYNEDGQPTGEELATDIHQLDVGAIALGQSDVVAFYAMVSRGAVASYTGQKSHALELPCSPRPYGVSNDHAYAGAICITQPGGLPEAGGDRILTSDFLLIRADGPQVVWRHKMSALGAGAKDNFGWASAVIEHRGKKVWVVAPTKSPELTVYEVLLPEDEPTKSKPTIP